MEMWRHSNGLFANWLTKNNIPSESFLTKLHKKQLDFTQSCQLPNFLGGGYKSRDFIRGRCLLPLATFQPLRNTWDKEGYCHTYGTYTAMSLWPRRAQGISYMLSSLTIEMQKADRASYMAESSRGCVMDCTSVPVQVCLFKVWFDKTCSCELAEVDSSFPVIFTPTLLSWTNKHTHGHTLGCQSKWAYLWLLLPRTSFKTKALSLHF